MSLPRRTDELLLKVVSVYLASGRSRLAVQHFFKRPSSTVQNWLEDAQTRGMIPEPKEEKPEEKAKLKETVTDGVVIVGSDAHYYPGAAPVAHRALLHFIRMLEPQVVVMNGDMVDGSTISRFPRIGWDNKPTVKQEIDVVRERLSEVEDACAAHGRARLYWPLGNHDARFETYLAAHAPQYQDLTGFSLKDFFPKWAPCWLVDINEDVVVKHRWSGGLHATHNNTLKSGRTMVTGHLHSLRVTPHTDYNGTRWGVDCGTLADLPGAQFIDYTEANPLNWRSGFVVLTFRDGRLLYPELVFVHDKERVDFRGHLIAV
jgi:hypothetical protein